MTVYHPRIFELSYSVCISICHTHFLTSALYNGQPAPAILSPGEKAPVPIEWEAGRPHSQYGYFGEEKYLLLLSESNHNFSVVQPIA